MHRLSTVLGLAASLSTTGYLFSKYTRTFVGVDSDYLSTHHAPLPLTIVTNRNGRGVELFGHRDGHVFKVTHMGSGSAEGFHIEMNRHGEIRLKNGANCETVYHGLLKTERCVNDARQMFIWVPQALFLNRHADSEEDADSNVAAPGGVVNASEIGKELSNANARRGAFCSKGHAMDAQFNNYIREYCRTSPTMQGCQAVLSGADACGPASNTEALRKLVGTLPMPIVDKEVLDNFDSILNKTAFGDTDALNPGSVRPRGFYAGYEDSPAGECPEQHECLRNPKNNMCYYRVDQRGNLIPLMKPAHCRKKKGLCDLTNKLDKNLCELIFKNDYSFFQKLIYDGYLAT